MTLNSCLDVAHVRILALLEAFKKMIFVGVGVGEGEGVGVREGEPKKQLFSEIYTFYS